MSGHEDESVATASETGRETGMEHTSLRSSVGSTPADTSTSVGPAQPHPRVHPDRLRKYLMLADLFAVFVGMAFAFAVQAALRPVPGFVIVDQGWLCLASLPAFALGAGMNHLYLARANERRLDEARNIIKTVSVGIGWMLLVVFIAQYGLLSRLWVIALAISVPAALFIERQVARTVFLRLRRSGVIRRRILIVGTDTNAIALCHSYQRNPDLGYEVVGFVGDDPYIERSGLELLGRTDDIQTILAAHGAVGVVISLASIDPSQVNILTRQLTDTGYHVALSSSLHDIDLTRLRPQQLDGRTMIYVEPTIRTGWRRIAKRVFDVSLATTILVVTAPIQFISMIAIKLDSRGPVYFRQKRVGKDGQVFEMVKLRTMVADAENIRAELAEQNEADGPLFKMERDPRVTRVGRVLRKLSIDELPQLVCVLRGTMSMVGPRPALPDEVEQWDLEVRERLRVLPGLTGMWQVSGRSDSSFEHYKRMDLYYVDNWTLSHDVRICTKTVKVVLSGRGAS